jgi:hypothetical protein
MMESTHKEDDLNPRMWAVYKINARQELEIVAVLPNEGAANRWVGRAGTFPGNACQLFEMVQEQGREQGRSQLLDELRQIKEELQALREGAHLRDQKEASHLPPFTQGGMAPAELCNPLTGDESKSPALQAKLDRQAARPNWWEMTNDGR